MRLLAHIDFILFICQQTAMTDKQFLRPMIPRHSGAILMCEQGSIQDPNLERLDHRESAG